MLNSITLLSDLVLALGVPLFTTICRHKCLKLTLLMRMYIAQCKYKGTKTIAKNTAQPLTQENKVSICTEGITPQKELDSTTNIAPEIIF